MHTSTDVPGGHVSTTTHGKKTPGERGDLRVWGKYYCRFVVARRGGIEKQSTVGGKKGKSGGKGLAGLGGKKCLRKKTVEKNPAGV